jgi:hypothetical protein
VCLRRLGRRVQPIDAFNEILIGFNIRRIDLPCRLQALKTAREAGGKLLNSLVCLCRGAADIREVLFKCPPPPSSPQAAAIVITAMDVARRKSRRRTGCFVVAWSSNVALGVAVIARIFYRDRVIC